MSHPGVAEAAVAGRPDEENGQALVAFVTLRPTYAASDALVKELTEHVGKEIGKFARPDSIRFTDAPVVRGYKKDVVSLTSLVYVDNDDYDTTQEVASLARAKDALTGQTIVSYGDVLFKKYIVQELVETTEDFVICVDANWRESRNKGRVADFVVCSEPNSKRSFLSTVTLRDFVSTGERDDVNGEWMGFLKVSEKGAAELKALLAKLEAQDKPRFDAMKMPDLLRAVLKEGHEVRVLYTTGHWLDVDSVEDVVLGGSF